MEPQRTVIVGVRELKNRLTAYLRLARNNHEVVVTERGKAVAVLRGLKSAGQVATVNAKLAKLAADNIVRPPTRRPLRRVRMVRAAGKPVSQIIIDDRR